MKTLVNASRLKTHHNPKLRRPSQNPTRVQTNDENQIPDIEPAQADIVRTQPRQIQWVSNDDVDKIIKLKRYSNTPWYYLQMNSGERVWVPKQGIPKLRLNEYHSRFTSQGKARKKSQKRIATSDALARP